MPNRRPTPTIRYPLGKLRRSSRLSGEKITNDDDDGALVVVLSKDTISGAGAGAGSLDYLRNSPKFQALRTMVQSNPHILQPILQELGKKDRGLLRRVEEHYSEFLQLINEPMDGTEGSANNNTSPAVVATTDYDKAEDINRVVNPNVDKMDEDAGKSTTGGQILFLSDQVDDRTIQKYEKEAKDKS